MRSVFQHVYKCKCCGHNATHYVFNKRSRIYVYTTERGLCPECAFWTERIEYPQKYTEIIDNMALRFMPYVEDPLIHQQLGGNGKTKYLLKTDGSVAKSNDIWVIGQIPFRFQDQLRPTGWFIKERMYKNLVKKPFVCKARQCFDRYHCLRFDISTEENENGPYNLPPLEWHVGDERCRFFIDIRKIHNYDRDIINAINNSYGTENQQNYSDSNTTIG